MSEPTAEKDARLANLCCGHVACQREVRERMAEAWDEGYDARGRDIANEGLTERTLTPNPYRVTVEHRLVGTGCICGRWKAGLGESITRGFDLHLLDRRCASCGEPIPTTKRVDAETCSGRCAKDRQRARVTSPGGSDA